MKKALNVGIVGTGFGKMIALNFKAVEPSTNIFIWGRNKEKTKNVSKEIGASGTYSSWQELSKDPKIDLVVIATPSSMHKEMSDYVSKYNKNILVEKPAALTSKEIGEMISKFSSNGKIAVVNHEGRSHPVVQHIKNLIDGNKLGDIMTIRIGAYLNWFSGQDFKENWNNDIKLGGGQIYSLGTHQIDMARYLLGFPKIVSGNVQDVVYEDGRFAKKPTADSQFSAHFLTKESTSIQLFNDTYCFGYKDFLIDIVGSKGIIMYSDKHGLRQSFSNDESLTDFKWVDPLPEITLGSSILSKSMKYISKALIESIGSGKFDKRFCSLEQEKENLELFEKFKS